MKKLFKSWKERLIYPFAFAGISLLPVLAPSALSSAEPIDRVVAGATWRTTIASYQMDHDKYIGQRLTIDCPARPAGRADASVYGTRTYSSGSSICYAALHAGAISAGGGKVTVQINPGAKTYRGSTRFGVTTQDAKKTSRSIVILNGPSPIADQVRAEHISGHGLGA